MLDNPENSALAKFLSDWIGYAWLLALAVWGGTANYLSRIRRAAQPFSFVELVGEWTVSGFAGVITALIGYSQGWDFYITSAAAGIAGHMGGRAIGLAEHWLARGRMKP